MKLYDRKKLHEIIPMQIREKNSIKRGKIQTTNDKQNEKHKY